jgi:hypothetical protein
MQHRTAEAIEQALHLGRIERLSDVDVFRSRNVGVVGHVLLQIAFADGDREACP